MLVYILNVINDVLMFCAISMSFILGELSRSGLSANDFLPHRIMQKVSCTILTN